MARSNRPTPEEAVRPRSSVIASVIYRDGRRVRDCPIDEAGAHAGEPGQFVWIGLHEPKAATLRAVQRQFGLHDLAIEDALNAHQRPKLEFYGETLFAVLPTARLAEGRIVFGETHVFVGHGFVVSVRHGASNSYAPMRARCEANPGLLKEGEDFVLYTLMDYIVDGYVPVLEAVETEIEELHHRLLHRPPSAREIERIYHVRRDLEAMRRRVVPMAEMCRHIEHHELPMIDRKMRPYFRDVSDHVTRVEEMLTSLRELLSFVFETSMMVASARQNDISRRLAAGAALLAVPTAITGFYGMNFENLPGLASRSGVYVVIAVIVAICLALFRYFRRSGWL
jgi:magnesium transporter